VLILQTREEHRAVYQAIAESVVAEPPEKTEGSQPALDPRVLAGCELLDREYPGWAGKINLARFNLSESTDCVIGQLFGDYRAVYKVLDIPIMPEAVHPAETAHGFNGPDEDFAEWDWELLDADWKVAIAARQR